jgi:galactokinase
MGKLMGLSHRSLRDDYQVSSPELDLLVDIAWTARGVLGARMTGGGFGGSTVNLVGRDCLDEFHETITREYTRTISIQAAIYVSEAAGGAEEVR